MGRLTDFEQFIKKFIPEMEEGGETLKRYDNVEHSYEKAFAKAGEGNKYLWTVVEGDNGKWYICHGFHLVNREMYLITEIPWEEGQRDYLYV